MDYCIINMSWLGQSSSNNQPSYGQSSYDKQFPQDTAQQYGLNGQITYKNGTYMHNGTHNVSFLHPNFSGQLIYHDNNGNTYTVQNGQLFDNNGTIWDGYTQLYDQNGNPYDPNSLRQFHNKKGFLGLFGGRRRKRKTLTKGGKRSRKSRKSRRRRTRRM